MVLLFFIIHVPILRWEHTLLFDLCNPRQLSSPLILPKDLSIILCSPFPELDHLAVDGCPIEARAVEQELEFVIVGRGSGEVERGCQETDPFSV